MPRFCCLRNRNLRLRIPNEHEASLVWDQDQNWWWDARDQLWTGLFEARLNGPGWLLGCESYFRPTGR